MESWNSSWQSLASPALRKRLWSWVLGAATAGTLYFVQTWQGLGVAVLVTALPLVFSKQCKVNRRQWGFACLVALAVFAPVLARVDPLTRVPPEMVGLLGVDSHGRDWFSRLLNGYRASLWPAALGAAGAALMALPLGALPVFAGRFLRRLWLLALQVQTSIPPLLPILLVLALFGAKGGSLLLVFLYALVFWPEGARMIQAETERLLESDFVAAARLQGASESWVFWREILPNLYPLLHSFFRLTLLQALLLEAVLGYLGLGRSLESPSLGGILSQGFRLLDHRPESFVATLFLLMAWLILLKPESKMGLQD